MPEKSIAINTPVTMQGKPSEQGGEFRLISVLRNIWALGVVLIVLCSINAFAQIDQGAIVGVVLDSSGAAIAGASVSLTSTDTGLVLKTTANASGYYFFSPIKTGHYNVSASAAGFETTLQENITVHVTDRLSIPLSLKPGKATETVTVNSAAPLLQTQTGEQAVDLDSRFLNQQPLANRNWVFAAHDAPGVTPFVGRGSGNGDFVVNGQHEEQNNFMLDGVDNNVMVSDYINGSTFNVSPPPDAIAEFKLETSNYSAEIGRGHGAVLNATTKSGTNEIHGDVWEYVRNTKLDALPWNFNTAFQNPQFNMNQFGATLGGPIIKNKLFYFGDMEESRYSVASTPSTMAVPTPLERQGNFTELLSPALTSSSCPQVLYQPNSNTGAYASGTCKTVAPTGTLQQYGNATVPAPFAPGQNVFNPATIDPVALNILKQYPSPNANGWNSSNNSNTSTVQGTTYNNYVIALHEWSDPIKWDQRLDWNISSRDLAYFRYDYQHQINTYTAPLGPILDGIGSNQGHSQSYLSENAMISETHTFSPTLINEFRFGYNWGRFQNLQYNYNVNEAGSLGMGGMPFSNGPDNGGLPPVTIGGVQAFGSHSNDPALEGENIYQIIDNVTKTVGNHSLKMGVEIMPIRFFSTATGSSRGTYTFSGAFTAVTGVSNTGNGVADFIAQGYNPNGSLQGTTNMAGGGLGNYALNNYEYGYDGAYFQDNWRVTHKLTLDLGLRYEYFTPKEETAGLWGNFVKLSGYVDSNGGHGASEFVMPMNQQKVPLAAALQAMLSYDNVAVVYDSNPRLSTFPKANWAPRLGAAYQLNDKTVLRLGAGVFFGAFEPGGGSALTQNAPFVITSNLTLGSCSNGAYCPSLYAQGDTLENGLTSFFANGNTIATYLSFPNVEEQDPVMHTPYTINYNLSAQRVLTPTMTATVSYVGNIGRHLVTLTNGPDMAMALTIQGPNNKSLQPAPQFSSAQWMTWEGSSYYSSLQAKVQKQVGHGLSFLGTYTFAHAFDNTVDLLGGDISGYRMAALIPINKEWTNSGYDIRQRVVVSGQYELPFGVGKAWANHPGVMDYIVGGWKSSLLWSVQTGEPFTIGISNQTNGDGGYNNHALKIGNPFSTKLTPPASTATTNAPGESSCPTQVRTKSTWYNECAYTNPLGNAQVAAHATGTYSYSSPAISGDGAITVPAGTPYINTYAGVLPFFGSVPNTAEAPGFWRLNMSLFKDFHTWREQYLEFRADAFNILNHPTLGAPGSTGDNAGNAGQITGPASTQNLTIDARFFQLSGKYYF
jgi:hypothetical protein